jgi:hypothetical protein
VTSDEKVGKLILDRNKSYDGVDNYSSGHIRHEYTSSFALLEVFNGLKKKKKKMIQNVLFNLIKINKKLIFFSIFNM